MNYRACVEALEKYAKGLVNCSHAMCSMAEATHEESFGKQIIAIIKRHRATTHKPSPKRTCMARNLRKLLESKVLL